MSPPLRVVPAHAKLHAALGALRVTAAQECFVSPVATMLEVALLTPDTEPMAIVLGPRVIGFYQLVHRVRVVTGYDLEKPAFGLLSLLLDAAWQGRGLGRLAVQAIINDVRLRYPQIALLALTVSARNLPARAVYRHCGFSDRGALYDGGRAGPQHLLWRELHLLPPPSARTPCTTINATSSN